MTFTKSTTRVSDAQDLWTYQLKGKATIDALTSLFATESQAWEEVADDILLARAIDTAVGDQLDDLGLIVGQLREGRTDDRYRVWIRARIAANRSSGSPVDMYKVASLIFGQDATLLLQQLPVGHALQVEEYFAINVYDVQRILQQTSPVAVPFFYWYAPETTTDDLFQLASGSAVVTGTTLGLDNGRLSGAVGYTSTEPTQTPMQELLGTDLVESFTWATQETAGELSSLAGSLVTLTPVSEGPQVTLDVYRDLYSSVEWQSGDTLVDTTGADLGAFFEGASAWSIAWLGSRSDTISDCTGFEAADGPSPSHYVHVGVDNATDDLRLETSDGTSTTFVGPEVNDTDLHTWIVSYDGAGEATFWVDGLKLIVVSGTHRTTAGLDYISVGGGNSPNGGEWGTMAGEMLLVSKQVSDAEALAIHDHLQRSYTDIYHD